MINWKDIVYIGIGGSLGAISRFLITKYVQKTVALPIPVGTLAVNVLGSFIIGFFMVYFFEHLGVKEEIRALVVVGFLGALTTFSSFSYETVFLLSKGLILNALIYFLLTNFLCFLSTFSGIALAKFLISL
jgi:CrcB protein